MAVVYYRAKQFKMEMFYAGGVRSITFAPGRIPWRDRGAAHFGGVERQAGHGHIATALVDGVAHDGFGVASAIRLGQCGYEGNVERSGDWKHGGAGHGFACGVTDIAVGIGLPQVQVAHTFEEIERHAIRLAVDHG
jgi:hypothetical protein